MGEPRSIHPRRRHDRWERRVAIAFVVLTACFATATWVNQRTEDSNAAHQRMAVIGGCERQNVKQAEDNRSQYADYVFFTAVLGSTRANLRHEPPTVREATKRYFLGPGELAAAAKAWVAPIADCTRVGVTYRLPAAIPFHVRLPPASALRP